MQVPITVVAPSSLEPEAHNLLSKCFHPQPNIDTYTDSQIHTLTHMNTRTHTHTHTHTAIKAEFIALTLETAMS